MPEEVKVSNYHENLPMQNTEKAENLKKKKKKKMKKKKKKKNRYFNKEILLVITRTNRDETHNLHVSNKKWGLSG